MYNKGGYKEIRLIICIIISTVLLFLDNNSVYTTQVRNYASLLFTPVYYIANVPSEVATSGAEFFTNKNDLLAENKQLKLENLQLNGMLQKLVSLEQENKRLRNLLQASEKVSDKLLIAELIHASTEPGVQQFVLNQGSNKSVYIGQAVIDANGVVGQVMSVNPVTSIVLLITDIEHATPVEILRNGFRAIAVGMGENNKLELMSIPNTADIIQGDVLVTSGLGKRFPAGYPVGKVVSVDKNPALPFAKIIVEPMAKLNQIKEALLIWPGSKVTYNKKQDPNSLKYLEAPLSNLLPGEKPEILDVENQANSNTDAVSNTVSNTSSDSLGQNQSQNQIQHKIHNPFLTSQTENNNTRG